MKIYNIYNRLDPVPALIGQKAIVYHGIKRKSVGLLFFATFPLVAIFIRDGAKHFFEEIYDRDLCIGAESFRDEVNITNEEEEAKTVEKSRFVELSKDNKIYIIKQINKAKPRITL